jgi:hypothetical protein
VTPPQIFELSVFYPIDPSSETFRASLTKDNNNYRYELKRTKRRGVFPAVAGDDADYIDPTL